MIPKTDPKREMRRRMIRQMPVSGPGNAFPMVYVGNECVKRVWCFDDDKKRLGESNYQTLKLKLAPD
jgi:hypothetical protein